MSALPRPDLPPGAHHDLVTALHDLHHRAGWPSLRTLARETGVSHTTVSKAMSSATLPSWGAVELLVEAMDGSVAEFHQLWLAASTPTNGIGPTAPRIAGRKAELDAVRRHLETGTGLLLVTGEAGIGKTTLVGAATAASTTVVAGGHCLPLATQIPLLPFTEAVRQLHPTHDGALLAEALDQCPDYVRPTLATLLPELAGGENLADLDERSSRPRLFAALTVLLTSLSARHSFALLLEDLHWADADSLDLTEHLVHVPRVTILGTWRADDPAVSPAHQQWLSRIRRSASWLTLGPLTIEETAEQLRLLHGEQGDAAVAAIHERSQGQPLFTEQLAEDPGGSSTFLTDLLDGRIGHLEGEAWATAALLGIAGRPLPETTVALATGIQERSLAATLRQLRERRLVDLADDGVQLRHPLLAEAVRRRLLASEARAVHRDLARALAAEPSAEAAEVALHWQEAGEAAEELTWRIRAADAATVRVAGKRVADQWLRALALWPAGARTAGDPPIPRSDAILGAAMQLDLTGQPSDAVPLLEEAIAASSEFDVLERAHMLRVLARLQSTQFVAGDRGLELVDESIALYRSFPPSEGLASALSWKGTELEWHGRYSEATVLLAEAAAVAASVGDRLLERAIRAQMLWQRAASGDRGAIAEIEVLGRDIPSGTSPRHDIPFAVRHTDMLLMDCRPAEDVEAAATDALRLADRWLVGDAGQVRVAKANVVQAWRRAGRTRRALEIVVPHTQAEKPEGLQFLHSERAILETLAGRRDAARRRLAHLDFGRHAAMDAFVVDAQMQYDVWAGEPARAVERFEELLDGRVDQISPGIVGDLLALTARAAADAAQLTPTDRRAGLDLLRELRRRLHRDPFGPTAVRSDRVAEPLWLAELARLRGAETMDLWLAAIGVWDDISRPHDAAYSRWRAAQCALREGQGTVAARLLKKAAADAHEHVPLSEAIAETARAARAASP